MHVGKPLLSADGIVSTFDSSWSIVVADISRTATSPIWDNKFLISYKPHVNFKNRFSLPFFDRMKRKHISSIKCEINLIRG